MATLSVIFFSPPIIESIDFPSIAILSFCAIIFSILDIKSGEVPRVFSIGMLFIVFFSNIFIVFAIDFTAQIVLQRFLQVTISGVFALLAFTLVFFVCRGKMGLADVWFSCAIGMVLGTKGFIVATLIACVSALLFYGILFTVKKGKQHRMSLPFIPFLSFGYFVVIVCSIFN